MNRNTLRKRLNTRKKRNTLKSSRRLNVSKRLNASKRLKKRTSKKQSGGSWYKYQYHGEDVNPGEYDMKLLKKNRVSWFMTDKNAAEKNIWNKGHGEWEDFLKKNDLKYKEYEFKINPEPVPLEGESLTQWAYLKNMDAVAKELPFFGNIEKPYLNRIVFHKYYGEGKVIDYEGGITGQGWFVQFISPVFGGDGISKIDQNFVEEFEDNSDSSKELPSKPPGSGAPSESPKKKSPSRTSSKSRGRGSPRSPSRTSGESHKRGSPIKSHKSGSPSRTSGKPRGKSPGSEHSTGGSVYGGDPNTKYVYTFMFSNNRFSGGDILVKREIQDTIGESIANYLNLENKSSSLGKKLVDNISEHPPSFNTMIRKLNIDKDKFYSDKEIYSSNTTMRIVIDLANKLLNIDQNYAYSEDVTNNDYPHLAKYLIFTKKLKELKEKGEYAEYIRLYSDTYFPGNSSDTGTGDTTIRGGGAMRAFLMVTLGLITVILAIAVIAGGGHVAAFMTFAIAKTNLSAGAGKAILAAIPKILAWGKVWVGVFMGISASGAVALIHQRYKIIKAYEKWIKKFDFKSGKEKEGRKILNSIRSDIIKEGRKVKSFEELTDEWFASLVLFKFLSESQMKRLSLIANRLRSPLATAMPPRSQQPKNPSHIVNDHIVGMLYDNWITKFGFKPGKEGEGREILNSIRGDVIRGSHGTKRSGELTDEWFASLVLFKFLSESQLKRLSLIANQL